MPLLIGPESPARNEQRAERAHYAANRESERDTEIRAYNAISRDA